MRRRVQDNKGKNNLRILEKYCPSLSVNGNRGVEKFRPILISELTNLSNVLGYGGCQRDGLSMLLGFDLSSQVNNVAIYWDMEDWRKQGYGQGGIYWFPF